MTYNKILFLSMVWSLVQLFILLFSVKIKGVSLIVPKHVTTLANPIPLDRRNLTLLIGQVWSQRSMKLPTWR